MIPSDPGQITYDGREIKVNVSVTKDDTTGNLEAAITYLEDNAPTEEPTFVNTYKSNQHTRIRRLLKTAVKIRLREQLMHCIKYLVVKAATF